MRNSKSTTVRSYANNQLVKAYVDKSVKYKGYMPKHKVNQVIDEDFEFVGFNPEIHSWVKETQEGNYLLVNEHPKHGFIAKYVTKKFSFLRNIAYPESEIEFANTWDGEWQIIPKVSPLTIKSNTLLCPRGLPMSRYNGLFNMPSDNWLIKYFDNGGLVDAVSPFGFDPEELYSFEKQGIDPIELAKVFKIIGRSDFGHKEYILEMIELGLQPKNRKEYGRNCWGIDRRNVLEKFGVPHKKGVISLGYMSQKTFLKLILKGATTFKQDWYWSGEGIGGISPELMESLLPSCNKMTKKYVMDYLKHQDRRSRESTITRFERRRVCSKKAVEYLLKKGHYLPRKSFLGIYNVDFKTSSTSIGMVKSIANGSDFSSDGKLFQSIPNDYCTYNDANKLIQAKRVAGYWVAKVKSLEDNSKETTFIWQNSFSDHFEAQSLREGLEMIQKRAKKASLILCLNDVRNDRAGTAGYCLAGTKSFAQARMPFMYRLISQYYEWKDIPEDIMSLEFHLASKSIFNGFRNPVS